MAAGIAECRASQPVAERLKPLAKGEVAAVGVSQAPKPPPTISFAGPDGQAMSLSGFKGKQVAILADKPLAKLLPVRKS